MTYEEACRVMNDCRYLYLDSYGHGLRDSQLRIELIEATLRPEVKRTPGGEQQHDRIENILGPPRAIAPDDPCAHFTMIFSDYIALSIINENYAGPEANEPSHIRHKLFRTHESSFFRSYLSDATFATVDYPGPFKHFEISCLNHVLNIASEHDPTIVVSTVGKISALNKVM